MSFVALVEEQRRRAKQAPTDYAANNTSASDENAFVNHSSQQAIVNAIKSILQGHEGSEAQDSAQSSVSEWVRQRAPEGEQREAGPAKYQEVESHVAYIQSRRQNTSSRDKSDKFKNKETFKSEFKTREFVEQLEKVGIEREQAVKIAELIRQIQIRQQIELEKGRGASKEPSLDANNPAILGKHTARAISQGYGRRGIEAGNFAARVGSRELG